MHFWYSLWLLGLIFSNACFFCFVLFFYYLYWYLISRFWRDSISRGFIFTISAAKHEKGHYFSQFRVLDFILGFKSLTLLKKKKKKKTRLQQAMLAEGGGWWLRLPPILQFAKKSTRVLPADVMYWSCTLRQNHRSTVLSPRRDCFSLLYFGNSKIYWFYVAFQT